MPSPDDSGKKAVVLEPQPHGGALLRSGGPGRPKARDTVAGKLRESLFGTGSDKDAKGIVDALIAKALKGDTRAIELCLHYGIGKPTDKVEVSGPDGGPITHATQDLDDHERRALRDAINSELQRRETAGT